MDQDTQNINKDNLDDSDNQEKAENITAEDIINKIVNKVDVP